MILDQILFETPDMERTRLLQEYLTREELETVRVEGSDKPVKVTALGREIEVSPQGTLVTPKLAIELLYLYGEKGIYRHLDQLTGHSPSTIHLVEDSRERARISARFQEWFLTCRPRVEATVTAGVAHEE